MSADLRQTFLTFRYASIRSCKIEALHALEHKGETGEEDAADKSQYWTATRINHVSLRRTTR